MDSKRQKLEVPSQVEESMGARFFLFFCFGLMLCAALIPVTGHDFQRATQVVLSVISLFYLLLVVFQRERPCSVGLVMIRVGLVLLSLGVFSAIYAHQVFWAFVELSLVIACCTITVAVARSRDSVAEDRLFFCFIVVLCFFKTTHFIWLVVDALKFGGPALDTDTLITGFSNKRFYGQFQTFTLPLLALPLLLSSIRRPAKICFFLLLSLWWMIAITGGTRGTWLGMGAAGAVLFLFVPSGRRWLGWQVAAVLLGLLLYWLTFSVLTGYLGIEIASLASDRLTTTLSGRGPIWQQAWDMIRERPWLGFGPMHFADIHNPIAAHPHQAILQWASEWGIPSALLVGALAMRGLYATFRLIRERAHSIAMADLLRLCLFASLIGALTQSMVDGVIVMPYSQLWLALVVGWLMGLHVWKSEPEVSHLALRWGWVLISVAAVAILVFVVIRDLPHLKERNQQYREDFGGHYQPRFWTQGVIAEKKP